MPTLPKVAIACQGGGSHGNQLLSEHPSLAARYQPIRIRVVELGLELDYPSKLDRSGALIERLLQHGRERAGWFFDERSRWPREGTVPGGSTVATAVGAGRTAG